MYSDKNAKVIGKMKDEMAADHTRKILSEDVNVF